MLDLLGSAPCDSVNRDAIWWDAGRQCLLTNTLFVIGAARQLLKA